MGGRGDVSIKREGRFGRILVESIWQNKYELGVTSISQIVKSRCSAFQRHLSLVYFYSWKWSRLRSGNACYHSVQNLLSSRLLTKNLKIKIYRIIILPVVLYGCEGETGGGRL